MCFGTVLRFVFVASHDTCDVFIFIFRNVCVLNVLSFCFVRMYESLCVLIFLSEMYESLWLLNFCFFFLECMCSQCSDVFLLAECMNHYAC